MSHRRPLFGVMAVAAAIGAASPGAAATVPCATTFTDGSGTPWPVSLTPIQGVSLDGMTLAASYARVDIGTTPFADNASSGCTSELGGRQIAFPLVSEPTGQLELKRTVYVPASGPGFARVVDTVSNTTNAPVQFEYETFQYDMGGGLGVIATSSGDTAVDQTDSWVSTQRSFPHAQVLLGPGGTGPAWTGSGPYVVQSMWNVTVPALSRVSFLQVVAQGAAGVDGEAAVVASANRLAAMPKDLLYGMTTAQLTSLVNWSVPSTDTDGDGVLDAADLCPTHAGTSVTGCDVVAPVARVSAPSSMTRAAFLRGVPVSVSCNEGCSARVRLVARATTEGRLMSTMRVLLSEVTSSLGTATKRVSLVPRKRLVVSRTSFTAYVKVMVTDASGNVSYATKRVHVD